MHVPIFQMPGSSSHQRDADRQASCLLFNLSAQIRRGKNNTVGCSRNTRLAQVVVEEEVDRKIVKCGLFTSQPQLPAARDRWRCLQYCGFIITGTGRGAICSNSTSSFCLRGCMWLSVDI